jgi:hypothetical protein
MRKGWFGPGARYLIAALALLTIAAGKPALAADRAPDLVLKGQIAGADNETYRRVAFDVPAGIKRLTLVFSYTGKADRTVIDMGLWDGTRFRGWSGGARDRFTLSAGDATPGYLPGLLPAGKWMLMLGVPNIRRTSHASFEARVFFDRTTGIDAVANAPLSDKPGWYRGDLHMHTAHSDATCAGQDGVRAPCPVYRTVEAAAARGLDFIAITDHNTISQYDAERELQPAFSHLLLMPGREITTFKGHANVFGPTAFIDFRLGDKAVPDIKALEAATTATGGLFSVNHPSIPYGENCMGCGWIATDTDWRHVQAIEIVNGGVLAYSDAGDGVFSGMPFWQARLNAGYRITGIGGSDNHDAGIDPKKPAAVGRPTTVVFARALSTPAILDGIRSGRVFVDTDGTRDRMLDISATGGGKSAEMGGVIAAPKGMVVHFALRVENLPGGQLELVEDGKPVALAADGSLDWTSDGARHWFRPGARDAKARLILIGNPIYVNFGP